MQTERLSELTRRYELEAAMNLRRQEMDTHADAVRWLVTKAMLGTDSDADAVFDIFAERYPRSPFTLQRKALTTGDGGAALLPPSTDFLISRIQEQTLPGRMNLPKAPFGVPVPFPNELPVFNFVLQGQPKPVVALTYDSVVNPAGKIAGIVTASRELAKSMSPGVTGIVTRTLLQQAVRDSDRLFLDPTITHDANGRPASITNGVAAITPTGTTIAAQVQELVAALFAGRPQATRPVLIATPAVASQLATGQTVAGQFNGVEVFPTPAAGGLVVAADADGIVYSDEGGRVDVSVDATVDEGGGVWRSLWQTNYIGFQVERWCYWQRVNVNVVQVLTVTP